MDNISILYQNEYASAKAYKDQGEPEKCLEILWNMRLYPDLPLFRRALVNLLIATTANLREHPDISKFAQESIDLVAQLRRDDFHNADKASEAALQKIEQSAKATLLAIESMFRKMRDKDTEAGAEQEDSKQKLERQSEDNPKVRAGDPGPFSNWTLEGMHTDYGYGYGYGPDGAKVDVGREKTKKMAVSKVIKKAAETEQEDPLTPHSKLPDRTLGQFTGETVVEESPQSTVRGTPVLSLKGLKDI